MPLSIFFIIFPLHGLALNGSRVKIAAVINDLFRKSTRT
uniref:Uncharacterized protein n=1 Tax=Arundo donax TaxID=35708 RepID=A0A0A9G461_ARUDO